jgi:hypothetical protein
MYGLGFSIAPGSATNCSGVIRSAWASSNRASRRGFSIPAARSASVALRKAAAREQTEDKFVEPAMSTNPKTTPSDRPSNLEKDPDDWTTGDEPMTGAQASYLKTLSEEAGEEFDDSLTKAEASKRIDALQEKTGRGKPKG